MIRDHDRRHLNLTSLLALDLSFVRRAANERDGDQKEVAASPAVDTPRNSPHRKHRLWLWTMARRWSRRWLARATCHLGPLFEVREFVSICW